MILNYKALKIIDKSKEKKNCFKIWLNEKKNMIFKIDEKKMEKSKLYRINL